MGKEKRSQTIKLSLLRGSTFFLQKNNTPSLTHTSSNTAQRKRTKKKKRTKKETRKR
jgi:hypothetical protein